MKKSLAAAGLLGVAACSSGGNAAAPSSYGGPLTQQQGVPGANGEIAAIDGHTLQVQSSTEQTAVTWSSSTTFTDTVATTAAAVRVGSCVLVRESTAGVAGSVEVSAPVNGSCGGPAGGPAGGPQGGLRGTPPPGFTPPSGGPRRTGGGFGGAAGKVVSKTATGFVVAGTTITTTATTSYATQRKATAAALRVGRCVSARGQADTAGTVVARSIALRPKTNGTCSG